MSTSFIFRLTAIDQDLTEFMLLKDGKTSLRVAKDQAGRRIPGIIEAHDVGGDLVTKIRRRRNTDKHVDIDTAISKARVGGPASAADPKAFLRHARALGRAADRVGATAHTTAAWFGNKPSKPGNSWEADTERLNRVYKKLGFRSNPAHKRDLLQQAKRRGNSLRSRQDYSRYLRTIDPLKRDPVSPSRPPTG